MGVTLSKSPLIYVLSQLIINHQKMETYVSSFQEKLIDDYPDFREEQSFVIQLPQQDPSIQNPPTLPTPVVAKRWHFLDMNGNNGFVLTENGLVFHTIAYKDFDDFLRQTMEGIRFLNEAVKIRYVDRIALRYINAIPMTDKENCALHPALRGMVELGTGNYEHAISETNMKFDDDITLVLRSIRRHKMMAFPQELLPLPMSLKNVEGESVVTLDLDCFSAVRRNFTAPDLLEKSFTVLHTYIEDAFRKAIDLTF